MKFSGSQGRHQCLIIGRVESLLYICIEHPFCVILNDIQLRFPYTIERLRFVYEGCIHDDRRIDMRTREKNYGCKLLWKIYYKCIWSSCCLIHRKWSRWSQWFNAKASRWRNHTKSKTNLEPKFDAKHNQMEECIWK